MPFRDPAQQAAWRRANRAKTRETENKWREKNKARVLAMTKRNHRVAMRAARRELAALLGGKCRDCGTTDERVFQFHHTGNNGFDDRGESGSGNSQKYYRQLAEKVKRDKDYVSLICANCHAIRHWITDEEMLEMGDIPKPSEGRITCQRR